MTNLLDERAAGDGALLELAAGEFDGGEDGFVGETEFPGDCSNGCFSRRV